MDYLEEATRRMPNLGMAKKQEAAAWTFLTNYTHILVCLDQDKNMRIRDLALEVGITERAVQNLLAELVSEGVVTVEKEGRRNRYKINRRLKLRHPLESQRTLGQLLDLIKS